MTQSGNTIIGPELRNIPWQEKSANCSDVVWRYSENPVIPRDLIPCSNSIFNSAVVPFEDGFAGVFRVDDPPTGRIAIYYGCADTATDLAFTQVDDLIAFTKANSEL